MFKRIAIAVLVAIGLLLVLSAALSLAALAGEAVPQSGAGEGRGASPSMCMALPAEPSSRLAGGPTSHSGVITTSETWDAAGNPHVLDDDVRVSSGVILTIERGVVVKGKPFTHLKVDGHMAAQGTLAEPILFTSWDDSGPDEWDGLEFDGGAGGGTGHLRYATVRYSGGNIYVHDVTAGQVRLENSEVRDARDFGLSSSNSWLVITDTTFAGNGANSANSAVLASGTGAMTVTGSTFENNAGYGLYTTGGADLWLSGSDFNGNGNYPLRTEGHNLHRALSGNTFSGNTPNRLLTQGTMEGSVTFASANGLTGYELDGSLKVSSEVTLTIEPGLWVYGRAFTRMTVEGHLDALGTAAHPITFTSAADSGPGEWYGLKLDGGAGGGTGHLRYATVRYSGGNIYVHDVTASEVRLENSEVRDARDFGLSSSNSQVVIHETTFAGNGANSANSAVLASGTGAMTVTGSTFENNAGYGLYTTGGADLWLSGSDFAGNGNYPLRTEGHNLHRALSGNSFSGNTPNRLLTQGTMEGSVTFAHSTGLAGYELQGNLQVAAGLALTVQPGVLVMGRGGTSLKVEGHLDAVGTITRPITFTSDLDSSPGQWNGLTFEGGPGGGTGYLRYATVRYGRNNVYVHDVTAGELRIESSSVRSALDHGLTSSNGRVVIHDTTFASNGDTTSDCGLVASAGSVMTVTGSTFDGNAGYGLQALGDNTVLSVSGGWINGNGADGLYVPGGLVSLSVTGARIVGNTGDGVDHNGLATPVMRLCQIYDNGGLGVGNRRSSICFDAAYNYWGDCDGPNDASGVDDGCMGPVANPTGGEEVSDDVYYLPWAGAYPITLSIAQSDVCTDVIDYTAAVSDCSGLVPLTWRLAFSDGGEVTGSGGTIAGSYTLLDPAYCGSIHATLTVSDDYGCVVAQGSNTVDVNQAPQIDSLTLTQPNPSRPVLDYNGTISDCDDPGVLTWQLDFSDGGMVMGAGAMVAGSYELQDAAYAGNIDATLTVTDDQDCAVTADSNTVDVNQPPELGTVDPSSGSGPVEVITTFTTTWRDANGWEDLKHCYFHIGDSSSIVGSVTLLYNAAKEKLWLRSDDGSAWTGGSAPDTANTLENSQAIVHCSLTTAQGSGDTLSVAWAIEFKPGFEGAKKLGLKCKDRSKAKAKGKWKGTWTIG